MHLTDVSILSALRSAPNNSLKMRLIKGLSALKEVADGNFVFNRTHKFGKIHQSNFMPADDLNLQEDTSDLAVIVHTVEQQVYIKGLRSVIMH